MTVDADWWDKLCEYARLREEWPTEVLKGAADRQMVMGRFIEEPTDPIILSPIRRHPSKAK